MKILITGASGFIGTNMLQFYLLKKYNVFNFDIKAPQNRQHRKYWYKVDLANYKIYSELLKKINPTHVIHLAARTDLNGKSDKDYYSANVKSIKNTIKLCTKQSNIVRIIFASTMLVNKAGYKPKNIFDYNPDTFYGKSKVLGENIILKNQDILTEFCIIRPTSIWGEWFKEPYKNFFNFVIKEQFFHPGNKACKKTYGYVGNSIYQIDKLLFADIKKINKKTFYIGDKPSLNISNWANEIAFLAGVNKPKKIPFFVFKLLGWIGDIFSKLGFNFPMTSFRLKNMITDRVYDLKNVYKICGNPPYNRKIAIKRTLNWILNEKK